MSSSQNQNNDPKNNSSLSKVITNSEATVVLKGDSETMRVEKEAAQKSPASLIIIRGQPQGKRFELAVTRAFLGRDASADIVLNDPNASRKHAEIFKHADGYALRDNKSTNGTFVNDKAISGEYILKKEDMIKIGNTILKYLPAGELEIFYLGSLESAAHTDSLTKIYNKGYIMEALEAEFKRSKALHTDFSIIIFDLDYFKKINDNYGHAAGDFVLETTAKIVKEKVLPKDAIFGRFGGEEFLILLPRHSLDKSLIIAESLRSMIEKTEFIYEKKRLPVTTSVGVAEGALDVDSAQALFKNADRVLYEAKNRGRNQVCS